MNSREMSKIITGLEHLAEAQDASMIEIVNALIEVCFNEEEAREVNNYIIEQNL